MKKFLLVAVAAAAFGAPLAATNPGADVGVRSGVAATAFFGTGSDKSVARAAGTSDSATVAGSSTYILMFLGLGLIGLSLGSRRDNR